VCGGANRWRGRAAQCEGRSPRVRGSRYSSVTSAFIAGSIPACAGEPIDGVDVRHNARVDPRVCGGARGVECAAAVFSGRSPRVRGSRRPPRRRRPPAGSIPACAGEPPGRSPSATPPTVDPRVCGGAVDHGAGCTVGEGRSPRVRGSPASPANGQCPSGSIPACAGEPCRSARSRPGQGVDPRVCGGARVVGKPCRSLPGRSPRVRGSLYMARRRKLSTGSIPACAGEPPHLARGRALDRVDPRVCGGAVEVGCGPPAVDGRSPRVRGSLEAMTLTTASSGSIPACAGEPPGRHVQGQ